MYVIHCKFDIFWFFCSKFGDIFDEDFFIYALRNHVNVIRELPEDVLRQFDNNISNIVNLRVKAWSSPKYYLERVLPKLVELKYGFLPFFSLIIIFPAQTSSLPLWLHNHLCIFIPISENIQNCPNISFVAYLWIV